MCFGKMSLPIINKIENKKGTESRKRYWHLERITERNTMNTTVPNLFLSKCCFLKLFKKCSKGRGKTPTSVS